MRLFKLFVVCIIVLGTTRSYAKEIDLQPAWGINLNTADLYELSVGTLFYKGHYGMATNLVVNHNKIGTALPLFYKSDGPLHNCVILFLRPKYEYYYDKDMSVNYQHHERSVLGLDLGVGGSGSSPLVTIFTGLKHEMRRSKISFVFGVGLNL